jgi:hypothetical protein
MLVTLRRRGDRLTYAKQLLRRERDTKAVEVWIQGEMVGRVDRERP